MKVEPVEFARKQLHLNTRPVQIPGSEMWSCEDSITSKMSADWLERFNTKNTNQRQSKIDHILGDMEEGVFLTTHQGLAFDWNGVLISGQNRLYALSSYGKPIRMLVFLNCQPAERRAIDQMKARTVQDIALLGFSDNINVMSIAAARAMAGGMTGPDRKMSGTQLYKFTKTHREALNFVMGKIPKKVPGLTAAPVLAAMLRGYYHLRQKDLREFIESLMSGHTSTERDQELASFRTWLMTHFVTKQTKDARQEAYQRTLAYLQFYQTGELNGKKIKEEIYALPATK